MSREEELIEQISELRAELDAIQDRKKESDSKKLVGNCYKYKNGYGGDSEDEKWWLYLKVTGYDEGGGLRTEQFQNDNCGRIDFEFARFKTANMDGYVPIGESEYEAAKAETLDLLKNKFA